MLCSRDDIQTLHTRYILEALERFSIKQLWIHRKFDVHRALTPSSHRTMPNFTLHNNECNEPVGYYCLCVW